MGGLTTDVARGVRGRFQRVVFALCVARGPYSRIPASPLHRSRHTPTHSSASRTTRSTSVDVRQMQSSRHGSDESVQSGHRTHRPVHGVDHRGQLLFGNSPCEAGSMGMSHVQTMLHQPVSAVETLCRPYVEGTSERIESERGRISKM